MSVNGIPPKSHLAFGRNTPFEHIVLERQRYDAETKTNIEQLHPALRSEINQILSLRNASRGAIFSYSCVGLDNYLYAFQQMNARLLALPLFLSVFYAARNILAALEEKFQKSALFTPPTENIKLVVGSFIPYLVPSFKTCKIGNLMREIASNDEAPLNHPDYDFVLQDYHRGKIDNAGNLIFEKHPLHKGLKPVNFFQRMLLWLAWHQPFQRQTFFLNPPEKRERLTIFESLRFKYLVKRNL